jgi:hypothetical protein
MQLWDATLKYEDCCKKCLRIYQHRLVQSGNTLDSKSKKCPVCDTLHSDKGEIYDGTKPSGSNTMLRGCQVCGCADVVVSVYANQYYCPDCKKWYLV